MKDYYKILGVDPEAESEVIVFAYKALVKKYHPDIHKAGNAQERMKEINLAYDVLKDKAKRDEYDRTREIASVKPSEAQTKPEYPQTASKSDDQDSQPYASDDFSQPRQQENVSKHSDGSFSEKADTDSFSQSKPQETNFHEALRETSSQKKQNVSYKSVRLQELKREQWRIKESLFSAKIGMIISLIVLVILFLSVGGLVYLYHEKASVILCYGGFFIIGILMYLLSSARDLNHNKLRHSIISESIAHIEKDK